MLDGDWDVCSQMANEQANEGAHVLDVCVDYVGRDGAVDMDEIAWRFATQASVPLVIDSTEPPVMEAGLQHIGGRAILNSVNLEDGEPPGSRFDRVMTLACDYGAAVICLLIDEHGQALRRVEAGDRPPHPRPRGRPRRPVAPRDLIFDGLTFPISTGDDDLATTRSPRSRRSRRVKAEFPGVFTALGVSNVCSRSSPCPARPQPRLPTRVRRGGPRRGHRARGRRSCRSIASPTTPARGGTRPRVAPPAQTTTTRSRRCSPRSRASTRQRSRRRTAAAWPVDERLKHRIIDGDRDGLEPPTSTRPLTSPPRGA